MRFLVLNGPNLNLVGIREPGIYGTRSMAGIIDSVREQYPDDTILYLHSNHEGDLINALQTHGLGPGRVDAIILNAGGYTHTSVALADAVAAIESPVIEVHLSDVDAREDFRRRSFLRPACAATITALGPAVYSAAIEWVKKGGECQ